MAEIKIDSKVFQERLSHFITAWKSDKRSGDALFAGASSIVILMGKVDEKPEFYKNNAMHVCSPQRRCPCTDNANEIAVLAAWLRVSDDADALHSRHPVHPHDPEKRFVATDCAIGNIRTC